MAASERSSRKETIRFFEIASGSASETQSHLLISRDFGYISRARCDELTAEITQIQRMLFALIDKLPD